MEELVGRFEARGFAFWGLEFAQAALFHLQIQLDVMVGGGGRLVTQQQGDDHDIDIGLEQTQGGGVTEGVR